VTLQCVYSGKIFFKTNEWNKFKSNIQNKQVRYRFHSTGSRVKPFTIKLSNFLNNSWSPLPTNTQKILNCLEHMLNPHISLYLHTSVISRWLIIYPQCISGSMPIRDKLSVATYIFWNPTNSNPTDKLITLYVYVYD